MFEDTSVREWCNRYDLGNPVDVWYDWFCSDSALPHKTKRLAPKVKKIAKSPKIDPDNMYVWFKNNCPLNGSLYDDFRFADRRTGHTIYCIVPHSGFNKDYGCSEVWGMDPNNEWKCLVKGTWQDVLEFFGV